MPRLPRGKVGVMVIIDKEVWDEFRKLAFMKHDHFRGALSYEVEQALRNWLALHRSSAGEKNQRIPAKVNPKPKVAAAFDQVKEYLSKKFNCPITTGAQVSRSHIIEAISNTRGTDPKTISKWLSLFEKLKLIKHVSGEVYEVL